MSKTIYGIRKYRDTDLYAIYYFSHEGHVYLGYRFATKGMAQRYVSDVLKAAFYV